MPAGPGDDILDAIEAGKDDSALMKDYKLNTDQVNAFRSLYYGITNRKIEYGRIKDYYPELKTYFSGGSPAAPAMPREDFTKLPKQKAVTESSSVPTPRIVQDVNAGKKGVVLADKLTKKVEDSNKSIYEELKANDDVVEKMIRNQRYQEQQQAGMNQFAGAPRTDMPSAANLANIRNQIEPEVQTRDSPVSPEEIGILKGQIATNEPQARQFVNQVITQKPEKAAALQSSMYALDANERMKQNPNAALKINKNIDALEKGELKYNAQTGQLIKELEFFPSLVAGVKERTRGLDQYKMMQLPKDQVIKIMEQQRAAYDPEDAIEVPKGAGTIGQMFGSEWATISKGVATTLASSAAGSPEAAPYISAFVNGPEYFERGYASGFEETYNQMRSQGKSEDEAYEAAKKQGQIEGGYDAMEGMVSSFIGGRIGIKELPKFKITGGFKNAVKNVITKSTHFAKETTIEGLTDGAIAAYLQDKKNEAARAAGMVRSDDSLREAFMGELTFALAAGGLSQAGRAFVDPNTYKKLVYWITKQPTETTNAKLGEMVVHGDITKEDADNIQAQIKEQKRIDDKIPDDIKDVSRMAMHDKIARREALEKRLETEDEALHPPIKEEIKKLNEEILEHSTHKKEATETEEQEETQPSQPGAAENIEGDGIAAPVAEKRWTDPTTDREFVLRDGRLHAVMDGKEIPFSRKTMQTKYAKNIMERIQQAPQTEPTAEPILEQQAPTAEAPTETPVAEAAPMAPPVAESVPSEQAVPVAEPEATPTPTEDVTTVAEPAPPVTEAQAAPGAAPVGEQHWTDPETDQEFFMKDGRLHTIMSGKEVAFSDKAMQSKHVKSIMERMQQAQQPQTIGQEAAAPQITAEDITINTEEDLDAALQKRFAKPIMVEKKSSGKKVNKQTEGKPLPKLTESAPGQGAPVNKDVTQYTSQSIIQKARETFKGDPLIERTIAFLEPLVKANPNIRIDHDSKMPGPGVGYSHPDGRIQLAFDKHRNEGALLSTALHELIHAVTRFEITNNSAFSRELESVLGKIRKSMGLPNSLGILNTDLYGVTNAHELIAELFTNQQFRDRLAGMKYEGDSALKKIFQVIAKYLSHAYKILTGIKADISADNLADYLMELTEQTVTGRQGADTAGALPSMAPQSQEDALLAIIKATPKSISNEKLKERIMAATGLDEKTVQDLIDEVRVPKLTPPPDKDISQLTQEQINSSLRKTGKLFDKEVTKKPGWWQKNWDRMTNASEYMDNPYRFITKTANDINKEYGAQNKEVIPLGRVFEKNSSGRATLRVEEFINGVIFGKIGDKKYGKLKGEKANDFQMYLAMRRVVDRLTTQENKIAQGEESVRLTGNITKQDAEIRLMQLSKKYGKDGMDEFAARAGAFRRSMDTMMKNLVASGDLSLEQYQNIKDSNEFYAPFAVVQKQIYAGQKQKPISIAGVVKRIKGINYKLPTTTSEALSMMNALADAVNDKIISAEEYFNTSIEILDESLKAGAIQQKTYDKVLAQLESPGFALNNILDAAANMIYKAEGIALKNRMMQRLYSYKHIDTKGIFIQDVDGHEAVRLPNGETRMVPKPLDQIKVNEGFAPVKLKLDGNVVYIAVNERAAEKLNDLNNYETATWMQAADFFNKIFRATVITLSPTFQLKNFLLDAMRTIVFSRYGALTGKGLVEPVVNAALLMPQFIEALIHSAGANLGKRSSAYTQWMESDSFSRGMFDNMFNNDREIKALKPITVKSIVKDFFKFNWIGIPGTILEQTPKLFIHQRALSVEGYKPEMLTTMLSSIVNKNIKNNMTEAELSDASDRINYEVQNIAGSPNFTQTHRNLKIASIFFQFLSARLKGEMTDFRRISSLVTNKVEGVDLSKQEIWHLAGQFAGAMCFIGYYAWRNIADDEDEAEFNGISPFHQDNYVNIPMGNFDYVDDVTGEMHTLRDYAKVPLRGVTSTMNVLALSFFRSLKQHNAEEFKRLGLVFLGNASPINLNGSDERELGESLASNMTPVFKFFIEHSFNRDTHNHRDLIPDYVSGKGMLSQYRRGEKMPYDVFTRKTPEWAKSMSQYLYEELGIWVSPITLDHMENTMGNPTEMYDNVLEKNLFRSESTYPLYTPKY